MNSNPTKFTAFLFGLGNGSPSGCEHCCVVGVLVIRERFYFIFLSDFQFP